MRTFTKKTLVGVTSAAVLVGSAGAAYAYWSTSGSGDGSATTGTSSAVTVVQDTPAVTGLVPGGPDQTITFHVHNGATFNQYVAGVLVSIKNVDATAWGVPSATASGACTAADFTITQPAAINADLTPGDHTYTAKIAMIDNASANQDNCKGVSVPLHFAAS